jgi:hypothetical protein
MKNISEDELREEAKKRVEFKTHLASYLIINAAIWLLYFVTGSHTSPPWPVWATFGWGIGLAFHYIGVYQTGSLFSIEKEMDKLRAEQKRKEGES